MKIDKKTWQYVGLAVLAVVTIVFVTYVLITVPGGNEINIPGITDKR